MKDNINLDTEFSKKNSKSHKLLNRVPEIEVENRLNIQYLRGKQQIRDQTEDEQVHKIETNTDLKPLKALPKG